MLPCSVTSLSCTMQPPYPVESTLDLETSFSPSQEVNSSSPTHSLHHPNYHHHHYYYYPMPSPPLSPSSFNYDFLFSADALPPLPPPGADPETGDELATVPPPPGASMRQASGRRRRFRTDRHSKIYTSQGLRDRRMRLSLGVARHFFRLQDMLGFDKASHTIDWLLKQSKSAIDLLTRSPASFRKEVISGGSLIATDSSASECEVVSGDSNQSKVKPAKTKDAARPARELLAVDARFKRESRAKARARARERTVEKRRRIKGEESFASELMDRFVTSEFSNEAYGCSQMSMISSWLLHTSEEAGSCKETKGGEARNIGALSGVPVCLEEK